MQERKRAGHLLNAKLSGMFAGSLVAVGRLVRDSRGEHADGSGPRNFSGQDIRTSYIERMEYVEGTDTTVIFTRNSIYFAQGDLINSQLGVDVKYAEGQAEIRKVWDEYQAEQEEIRLEKLAALKKPVAYLDTPYSITQEGHEMTGEEVGAVIHLNLNFMSHDLCALDEVPFSLEKDLGTSDLQKTVFLTKDMFEPAAVTQGRTPKSKEL